MNGIEGLLPAGKLPHSLLGELLGGLPHDDPRLLVGPTVGEDAAVIDFAPGSDRLLVAKSDPITFATDQIGYYAVNVCVNDLAVADTVASCAASAVASSPGSVGRGPAVAS